MNFPFVWDLATILVFVVWVTLVAWLSEPPLVIQTEYDGSYLSTLVTINLMAVLLPRYGTIRVTDGSAVAMHGYFPCLTAGCLC